MTTLVNTWSPGSARNNFTGFVGLQFTAAAGVTVSTLGVWMLAGDTTATVTLADDATGTVHATATISLTGNTPGAFYYGSVTPVALTNGAVYSLVLAVTSGGQNWADDGPVTLNSGVGTSPTSVFSASSLASMTHFISGDSYVGVDINGSTGTLYTASLSDGAATSDAFTAHATFSASIADTAATGDALGGAAKFISALADATTTSDIFTATAKFLANVADAAATADGYAAGLQFAAAWADAAGTGDNYQLASAILAGAFADTAQTADALAAVGTFLAQLRDAASASDIFTAALQLLVSLPGPGSGRYALIEADARRALIPADVRSSIIPKG